LQELIGVLKAFSPSKIRKTFSEETDMSYDEISEVLKDE
jgi:hypothetical protein